MKKILIVSSVSRQFYLFEKANIEVLHSLGFEVHAAANFNDKNERLDLLDIIRHHINIQRSPYSFGNLEAYRQLKQLMKAERFDIVHCHSPIGGVLARLAAKYVGIPCVIYTAHGFHFYKGAPIINWLIYYPIEKILSKITDIIITINCEDYIRAKKFKTEKIAYVRGIGIDLSLYTNEYPTRKDKRQELGISDDTIVLLSIGEMIKRKNHKVIIKALTKIKNLNYVYLICGNGELENNLKALVNKLKISQKVKFLGFRNDIPEICLASDVFLFPSYQEGLPVSLMEAMAAGLPVICSSIRGNIDLIEKDIGGYLVNSEDINTYSEYIQLLLNNSELRISMGKHNLENSKKYDITLIKKEMTELYSSIL